MDPQTFTNLSPTYFLHKKSTKNIFKLAFICSLLFNIVKREDAHRVEIEDGHEAP